MKTARYFLLLTIVELAFVSAAAAADLYVDYFDNSTIHKFNPTGAGSSHQFLAFAPVPELPSGLLLLLGSSLAGLIALRRPLRSEPKRTQQRSGNAKIAWFTTMAVTLFAAVAKADVLGGPIINPSNDHSYFLLTGNNWTGSEAEALTLGGHLVTINDVTENQWVFDTFSSFGGTDRLMWIGLHDAGPSGTFQWAWSSGEPATYFNWSPVEPNSSSEHFVYMYHAHAPVDSYQRLPGTWNNYQDQSTELGQSVYGVVEVVPEPSSGLLLLLGCLLGGLVVLHRRLREPSELQLDLTSASYRPDSTAFE